MSKVKPRFGPGVIGEYAEKGERLAVECMKQINDAEIAGLKLAGELDALAERICYLIGTGQVATDQEQMSITIDRTTRHLLMLNDLRIRRAVAYGNLLLTLGQEEVAVLLDKNPPIDVTEHHGIEEE